jgi:hypothetical protein
MSCPPNTCVLDARATRAAPQGDPKAADDHASRLVERNDPFIRSGMKLILFGASGMVGAPGKAILRSSVGVTRSGQGDFVRLGGRVEGPNEIPPLIVLLAAMRSRVEGRRHHPGRPQRCRRDRARPAAGIGRASLDRGRRRSGGSDHDGSLRFHDRHGDGSPRKRLISLRAVNSARASAQQQQHADLDRARVPRRPCPWKWFGSLVAQRAHAWGSARSVAGLDARANRDLGWGTASQARGSRPSAGSAASAHEARGAWPSSRWRG